MSDAIHELGESLKPGELVAVDSSIASLPAGCLLDIFSIRLTHLGRGLATAEMPVGRLHTNQSGWVQGGAITVFADATAGWATMAAIPTGKAFVTIEMSTSLMRGAQQGDLLVAHASALHMGDSTFSLKVEVLRPDPHDRGDKEKQLVGHFMCTQILLNSAT